jgi:lipopolysaccharide transport system permease protein
MKSENNSSDKMVLIKRSSGWSSLGLHELWEFRELFFVLLTRKFKGKHRKMAFGYLWVIAVPIINMVVFSFVFGKMAKLPSDGFPYPVFIYVALLPWQFFANGSRDASRSLLDQRNIISKIYFPRLLIPLSTIASACVEFLFSFVVLLVFLAMYEISLRWQIITLPLFITMGGLFALGFGLWLSCLAIKFHDVVVGLGFFLNIYKFLTPVVYSSKMITGHWAFLYEINPMAVVVNGFRWALLGRPMEFGVNLMISCAIVVLLVISGAFYFRRTERTIADHI